MMTSFLVSHHEVPESDIDLDAADIVVAASRNECVYRRDSVSHLAEACARALGSCN